MRGSPTHRAGWPVMSAAGLGLAALLVASAPRAQRILAGPGAESEAPPPEEPLEAGAVEQQWKLCRVRVSALVNTARGSRLVAEDDHLLFTGETLEWKKEISLSAPGREALLRLHARVRAAVARAPGVVYHVTTDAALASAVGFSTEAVGQPHVRHAYLEIADSQSHLHEAYVSPDMGARLVLAFTVTPVFGKPDLPLIGPPPGELLRFRVEVVARRGAERSRQELVDLAAPLGGEVSYAFGRLAPRKASLGADAEHPLGQGVTARDLASLPDSGFGDDHLTKPVETHHDDWLADHSLRPDSGWLAAHAVAEDTSDHPRHQTIRLKKRNLSDRQRRRLRAQQEVAEVKQAADLRSRTLPGAGAPPSSLRRDGLSLVLSPIHASSGFVQVEVRLTGSVERPGREGPVDVDVSWVEELERSVPLEISLAELLGEEDAVSDQIFVIDVQP